MNIINKCVIVFLMGLVANGVFVECRRVTMKRSSSNDLEIAPRLNWKLPALDMSKIIVDSLKVSRNIVGKMADRIKSKVNLALDDDKIEYPSDVVVAVFNSIREAVEETLPEVRDASKTLLEATKAALENFKEINGMSDKLPGEAGPTGRSSNQGQVTMRVNWKFPVTEMAMKALSNIRGLLNQEQNSVSQLAERIKSQITASFANKMFNNPTDIAKAVYESVKAAVTQSVPELFKAGQDVLEAAAKGALQEFKDANGFGDKAPVESAKTKRDTSQVVNTRFAWKLPSRDMADTIISELKHYFDVAKNKASAIADKIKSKVTALLHENVFNNQEEATQAIADSVQEAVKEVIPEVATVEPAVLDNAVNEAVATFQEVNGVSA